MSAPEPSEGPLHHRWGPYIRNIQLIADGYWLVEGQRGRKGTGKVWYPTIIRAHRRAGQPLLDHNGKPYTTGAGDSIHPNFEDVGVVKPSQSAYRADWKAQLWGENADEKRIYCEAYCATELAGIQFLTRNCPGFFL